MDNSKFWSTAESEVGKKHRVPKKRMLKSLGITGIVIVVLALIVSAVGYIFVVKPAYALVSVANTLKTDVQDVGNSLKDRDLVQLDIDLSQLEKDLENTRDVREEKFGWAKDIKLFKIHEFYKDSDRFINAGIYAVDALREVSLVVTPFADAAGLKVSPDQEIVETEGLMEAFQNWVSIMPEVADQMDGVIDKVSKLGKELEPIDTSKYPKQIRGVYIRDNIEFFRNTLSEADKYAPDIKRALMLFPEALGIGTPLKRYMIIMQNDKEIRPTGGFMTNYSTFKIDDGLLQSDFTSKDMYSIDDALDIIDAYTDFPDAPPAYMKYLKVERWYARDMNASPDFVSSMDQFMKYYKLAGQIVPSEIKPVSGIFAINTHVIKELLETTGPVTVNGVTYSSENVVLELEKIASLQMAEQKNRKKVLGDLMEEMLINVFEADKNLWPKLIEKAVDLAVRKHVLIYVFEPGTQELIEKYNFAGRIKDPVEGDYGMVVSTNLGGDKTNWFTSKEVDHVLSEENGRWIKTVKIKYTYEEPQGDYALFTKRFRDWVRVYAPAGSELIEVIGSEDGTLTDQERGKVWFSAYLEMGPGESKELVFKYYLPENTVGAETYDLVLQKQAGIDSELHRVTIKGNTQEVDLTTDKEISFRL